MHAAKGGHFECLQKLLEESLIVDEETEVKPEEPHINAKDENGMTALMHAAVGGYTNCLRALLNEGSLDIDLRDSKGRTALQHAIENEHEECVVLLSE